MTTNLNFFNSLGVIRPMVDTTVREALMSETHEAVYDLLKEVSSKNYQWPSDMSMLKHVTRVLGIDLIAYLTAQLATLSRDNLVRLT